jgi:hypothetical protein
MKKKKLIISEDNKNKALAGAKLHNFIKEQLSQLVSEGVIKEFKRDVNISHAEYSYKEQFLANFLIETLDDKIVIVRSTTSFRNDRAKIGFYDFNGILKHSSFSKKVIASVYLVPDTELNNRGFINIRKKIKDKEYYCPATHLMILSEFLSFLQGLKYEVLNSLEELSNKSKKEKGSFYGKRGNDYVLELVKKFSIHNNLNKYKNKNLDSTDEYKIILEKLLYDNKVLISDVVKVSATNSIPLLMNGGNPKTDILIKIDLANDLNLDITISVKNTNSTRVSCHDYKAKDYIRVLKSKDTRLDYYFNLFQSFPSLKAFKENLSKGYSSEEFEELLLNKSEIFNKWVLKGEYDIENLTTPELQISKYLLINKNGNLAFHLYDDYIKLISLNSKKIFGVPFSWTYPSKQRGKRIQLKMPVIV